MDRFPCTICGACCRNISGIEELKEYGNGMGICRYLEGNLCSIYNKRPEVCRVDVMYGKFYKDIMDLDTFFRKNIEACRVLQEKEKGDYNKHK